ncbi:MAG: TIGR03905 family TSCPD domain-containing protein [Succinatimonas hippei]|nr:TIGR03905 family TSCPD domain-containing protein [Succinatimonas hippei]
MQHHCYKTSGTCSKLIDFDLDEEGHLHNVKFTGGCDGNLKGISRLVEGQDAATVARILKGNLCRQKGTSCPDQLSKAITEALGVRG